MHEIRIDAIRYDPDLQMRDAGIDVGIVAEYADAMSAGDEFPPISLYFDGEISTARHIGPAMVFTG